MDVLRMIFIYPQHTNGTGFEVKPYVVCLEVPLQTGKGFITIWTAKVISHYKPCTSLQG